MKFLGLMILFSLAFICTANSYCNILRPCPESECCADTRKGKMCRKIAREGHRCDNLQRKYCYCAKGLICEQGGEGNSICIKL
ncbi:peptide 1-like [Parasteatoda tepidariorum]|uniref:peptide 1-like n=1 Tax=Parasteatoda tepidariorum TaxID=114398 RepID=UPI001C7279AC|nr:peptide 1-like [Parasteatoda tepidariorum]